MSNCTDYTDESRAFEEDRGNGTGYANGVQHAYSYNALNRLTDLAIRRRDTLVPSSSYISLQGYAYTLNKNGHRTQIRELSGRIINNTFDKLHRLTAEGITQSGPGILPGTITHPTGTLSYSYDLVGNRQSRTTTGSTALTSLLPNQTQSFTVNDRLTSDTYDANGNTTVSSSSLDSGSLGSGLLTDVYSFDNKLIRRTTADGKTIDLIYNTDGHRLSKLVSQNGLTQSVANYLTDANNPTGYAQVIEEKDPLDTANPIRKTNLYGHDLIATEARSAGVSPASSIFYQYDGLGSVRSISDTTGELLETYDYDAYGTLIGLAKRNPTSGDLESSPITNNEEPITQSEFLFTGEQFDFDLGMYFLRARYLNINTGRFQSQDIYEGRNGEPLTLHKYLYVHGNPVMGTDPSGNFLLSSVVGFVTSFVGTTLDTQRTSGTGAALQFAVNRIALLVLSNVIRIEIAFTTASATLYLADFALAQLGRASAPRMPAGAIPGDWLEEQLGANRTDYQSIDDMRQGADGRIQATSMKTREANRGAEQLLKSIEADAENISKTTRFKPRQEYGNLPILDGKGAAKGLIVGVPENRIFAIDPSFLNRVHQVAIRTRVTIQVIPLPGWRK